MAVTARKRPVHLNLFAIRFPVAAIMSGAHRISGVIMILVLPVVLYLLDLSLAGAEGFLAAKTSLTSVFGKLVVFFLVWALSHHFLAGLRYLALDVDIGIENEMARTTAQGVIIVAPVLAIIVTWGIYA